MRMFDVWQMVEKLLFQHTGGRENDFGSSNKSAQEPYNYDAGWSGLCPQVYSGLDR